MPSTTVASLAGPALEAADLTHHLSSEARARMPNPMKAIWKLTRRKPNMVSLANGDPHFSLYPIRQVQFEMASVSDPAVDPVDVWRTGGPSAPSQTFTSSRGAGSALPIQTALQYSHGAGLPDAQRAVTELMNHYHSPPDHMATLCLGNSDGVAKLFRLFAEPGDTFLADEFTFTSITNVPLPWGVKWSGVRMDEGGMIPEELERVLEEWNPARGRRPHVLYIVPTGQNPTGSTLSIARRKAIYAIAQRYDLIIIEDDPYYFLQYSSTSTRDELTSPSAPLVPSILSLDTDGRVVRVDSFSKIMAPGMRLGWISSSPIFHEHLVSLTDSSTHHPHAFGQMLITEMMFGPDGSAWGVEGFDRWVRSLRVEYDRRRQFFLDVFAREVAGAELASASVPEAGMFVWIKVALERHPRYRADVRMRSRDTKGPRTNAKELMEELFERCLDAGLVIMPASIFALSGDARFDAMEDPIEDRLNFLRATYSGTEEAMKDGLAILGSVLKEFFAEESS